MAMYRRSYAGERRYGRKTGFRRYGRYGMRPIQYFKNYYTTRVRKRWYRARRYAYAKGAGVGAGTLILLFLAYYFFIANKPANTNSNLSGKSITGNSAKKPGMK